MGVDHRENHATQLGEIIPQTRFGVSNLGLNLVLHPKLRGVPGSTYEESQQLMHHSSVVHNTSDRKLILPWCGLFNYLWHERSRD